MRAPALPSPSRVGGFAAGLVLLLAGCADDEPDPDQVRADLVATISDDLLAEVDGALDEAQARCVATALVDTVGVERLEAAGGARVVDEADDGLRTEVIDAFAGCDALAPLLEPTG